MNEWMLIVNGELSIKAQNVLFIVICISLVTDLINYVYKYKLSLNFGKILLSILWRIMPPKKDAKGGKDKKPEESQE